LSDIVETSGDKMMNKLSGGKIGG